MSGGGVARDAGPGGGEMLELRLYFGERDRDGDGPLEAAVMDACARRGVEAAVTLRGVEGFGAKQQLRTDRLLSLSEDAPLVVVAVGERARVERLAEEVEAMAGDGLVTLTPIGTAATSAAMAAVPMGFGAEGSAGEAPAGPRKGAEGRGGSRPGSRDAVGRTEESRPRSRATVESVRRSRSGSGNRVKATIWGPRGGPGSPHLASVAALHAHGAEAATVLLGVDGVLGGERRRARFVAGNRGVPAITVAIGERSAIEAALADLNPAPPLVTLEPVVTYRRIATVSHHTPPVESSSRYAGVSHHTRAVEGNSVRDRVSHHSAEHTRVTLVTSEAAAHGAHPRYLALIHALREEGAAGATALRGVWGFRGGREPHGDRVLALRRDVPIAVEVVDTAERAARWEETARSLAGEDDVVWSQPIPGVTTLG